jgi:hypothetical protein
VSKDPDDHKYIAAATEGRAVFVVAGDSDLLDLKEYDGIRIVSPGCSSIFSSPKCLLREKAQPASDWGRKQGDHHVPRCRSSCGFVAAIYALRDLSRLPSFDRRWQVLEPPQNACAHPTVKSGCRKSTLQN